jgi:hypothetical protein
MDASRQVPEAITAKSESTSVVETVTTGHHERGERPNWGSLRPS